MEAGNGAPPMTNRLPTTDNDGTHSHSNDLHSRDRAFILMNKLAHGGFYQGREADEEAILAFCNIRKVAISHTRQEESGVPPRAPPVALQEFAVPAAAASAGVALLASTTQEVDVPPVAPLAPLTREEPVAALVSAPSCAGVAPAVWTETQSTGQTTEMDTVDLPDANLAEAIAEAERRDTDTDATRAPRKRRALTTDDSDATSQASDAARPRKKAPRASRVPAAVSGNTAAGSSRSTANQRPKKKTQRPPSSSAASRLPDAEGFVAPPRRHTARAAALQQTQPLPTANMFAAANIDDEDEGDAPPAPPQKKPPPIVVQWDGNYKEFQNKLDRVATTTTVKNAGRDLYKVTVATNEEYRAVMDTVCKDGLPGRAQQRRGTAPSRKTRPSTSFAAATKGGPPAASTRRPEQDTGEKQQPTASSTASPAGVANPAPTPGERDAAPRRRRRRTARASPAATQRPAADTLPQQTSADRAEPRPRPTADAPRRSSTPEQLQPAAPVAEAAPAAPTASIAPDAAELRDMRRLIGCDDAEGGTPLNETTQSLTTSVLAATAKGPMLRV
ncbi:proteoglycan 4-like [Schistocerca gregaria]|uniref:proteoglycan 4-like n=1 Tax=Schistocerca gregaria TaxID=7010 RepID=UPI00211E6123|nr:proteoglycan 4-like [Schistocerca gregaria]XP_049840322.1 proteoglycan 4-like [Schistocerca gregaria]